MLDDIESNVREAILCVEEQEGGDHFERIIIAVDLIKSFAIEKPGKHYRMSE